MKNNAFNEEEWLNNYYNYRVSALQFIAAATPDLQDEYRTFCNDNNLNELNMESAKDFIDWWYYDMDQEEPVVDVKDEVSEGANDGIGKMRTEFADPETPLDIFDEWNSNVEILSRLSSSSEAVKVICWRLSHPTELNKDLCRQETGLTLEEVTEWWKAVLWLVGYAGGGHWHRLNTSEKWLKEFLFKACLEQMNA